MPPVAFYIKHTNLTISIEGYLFRLFAIIVVEYPFDFSTKDYNRLRAPMMPMYWHHRSWLQRIQHPLTQIIWTVP